MSDFPSKIPDDGADSGSRRAVLPTKKKKLPAPPVSDPSSTESADSPSTERVYTVDEMVARLKHSGGGSRSRKRRTQQPVIESRKKRFRWLWLSGGIVLAMVALWSLFVWLNNLRIEGDAYKESLNRRISSFLGFQVTLGRIRPGGANTLTASEAAFDVKKDDLVAGGSAHHVSAQLTNSSWFGNEWGIIDLGMANATLKLNPAKPLFADNNTGWVPTEAVRPSSATKSNFRLTLSSEPDAINIDFIRINSFRIEWPGLGGQVESLSDMDGNIKPSADGNYVGSFAKGKLTTARFPQWPVHAFNFNLKQRNLEISGARIDLGNTGSAIVRGNAVLDRNGALDLEVAVSNALLANLVPAEWKAKVAGLFSTLKSTWHSKFLGIEERELKGDCKLLGVVLSDIDFIQKLSRLLNNPAIIRLELDSLEGEYSWTPSRFTLKDFKGFYRDWLRLEGSVTVDSADTVSGELRVGIPQRMLTPALRSVSMHFSAPEEGWSYLKFTLSGNREKIIDDLPETLFTNPADRAVNKNIFNPDVPQQRTAPAPQTQTPKNELPAPAPTPEPFSAPSLMNEDDSATLFREIIQKEK